MSDPIDRQRAIESFYDSIGGVPVEAVQYVKEYADKMMKRIKCLPSIQPAKAKWIWKTGSRYECSECGTQTEVDEVMQEPVYRACPYCGADMCDNDGNVKWKRYLR